MCCAEPFTKSRPRREFNGEYIDAPMGEGKAELGVSEKRFLQVHQEMHAVAKYVHEEKLRIKKAKFFRRLNKVLDNKLVKPSIIIEYVNQYQRGEIK